MKIGGRRKCQKSEISEHGQKCFTFPTGRSSHKDRYKNLDDILKIEDFQKLKNRSTIFM